MDFTMKWGGVPTNIIIGRYWFLHWQIQASSAERRRTARGTNAKAGATLVRGARNLDDWNGSRVGLVFKIGQVCF